MSKAQSLRVGLMARRRGWSCFSGIGLATTGEERATRGSNRGLGFYLIYINPLLTPDGIWGRVDLSSNCDNHLSASKGKRRFSRKGILRLPQEFSKPRVAISRDGWLGKFPSDDSTQDFRVLSFKFLKIFRYDRVMIFRYETNCLDIRIPQVPWKHLNTLNHYNPKQKTLLSIQWICADIGPTRVLMNDWKTHENYDYLRSVGHTQHKRSNVFT